eukprot:969434_1
MSVLTTEKQLRRSQRSEELPGINSEELNGEDEASNFNVPSRSNEDLKHTRGALRLALMYIAAFLLTWIWPIVSMLFVHFDMSESFWSVIDHCKLIFNPLQGFFNALIFIYNKVHILRESDDLAFSAALKLVIEQPQRVPEMLLSQIELIEIDEAARMQKEKYRQRDIEIEKKIDDELNLQPEPVISQASIPSDFESNNTPSFALSNAISSKGIEDGDRPSTTEPLETTLATKEKYNFYAESADLFIPSDSHKDVDRSGRFLIGGVTNQNHLSNTNKNDSKSFVEKSTNEKNDDNKNNLDDGEDESGLSLADDDDGEKNIPKVSSSIGIGDSDISMDETNGSKISNYSELFRSWMSRGTSTSQSRGAVSSTGLWLAPSDQEGIL